MKRMIAFVLITAAAGVSPATAQTDFGSIRLTFGDVARVTLPSGTRVTGVVTDVTPDRIMIGEYVFEPEPGLKIDRTGDSLLTGGTLVGIGFGALVGGVLGDCFGEHRSACLLGGVAAYGSLGLTFDYLHRGHTTVFRGRPAQRRRPLVAPIVTRERKGAVFTFGF